MSEKYHNVIGIDLGTTYSAVATNNNYIDRTEILRPAKGDELTIPSVVSFDRINKKVYAGQDQYTADQFRPGQAFIKYDIGQKGAPDGFTQQTDGNQGGADPSQGPVITGVTHQLGKQRHRPEGRPGRRAETPDRQMHQQDNQPQDGGRAAVTDKYIREQGQFLAKSSSQQ